MYDDILGNEKEYVPEMTKDSIISAQKANIEGKQQMINDLLQRITELEIEVESYERI